MSESCCPLSLKISGLRKNFEKVSKKRRECFAGIGKSPTFASAFEKEAHQEEFFERFKINKQVVQDLLFKSKQQKPSILKQVKIDLVLEQIKTSIAIWKKIFLQ